MQCGVLAQRPSADTSAPSRDVELASDSGTQWSCDPHGPHMVAFSAVQQGNWVCMSLETDPEMFIETHQSSSSCCFSPVTLHCWLMKAKYQAPWLQTDNSDYQWHILDSSISKLKTVPTVSLVVWSQPWVLWSMAETLWKILSPPATGLEAFNTQSLIKKIE